MEHKNDFGTLEEYVAFAERYYNEQAKNERKTKRKYWLEYEPMKFELCYDDDNGNRHSSMDMNHVDDIYKDYTGKEILTLIYPESFYFTSYRNRPYSLGVMTLEGKYYRESISGFSACYWVDNIAKILDSKGYDVTTGDRGEYKDFNRIEYSFGGHYYLYFRENRKSIKDRWNKDIYEGYEYDMFSNMVPNKFIDRIRYYDEGLTENEYSFDDRWVEFAGEYIMFVSDGGRYAAYCKKDRIYNELINSENVFFDHVERCNSKTHHLGGLKWMYSYEIGRYYYISKEYVPAFIGCKFVQDFIEDNNLNSKYPKCRNDITALCKSKDINEVRLHISEIVSKSIINTYKRTKNGKAKL